MLVGRGGLTLLPVLVAEAVLEPLLPSISTRQGFTQKTAGLTYADLAHVFTYKPTAILLNKAYIYHIATEHPSSGKTEH